MNLDLLRKYRTQLMGFAMIMIVHNHMYINWRDHVYPIYLFTKYNYFGVEIFLLVSGLGIYNACSNENIKQFYLRRFMRIVPYSVPIIAAGCILLLYMKKMTIGDAILKVTLIDFYITGDISDWYSSVILFFYAISPFIFKQINRNATLTLTISFIVCYVVSLALYRDNLFMLISHIPVYTLGMFIGYKIKRKETKVKLSHLIILTIIGLLIILVNYTCTNLEYEYLAYYTHYLPFFFLVLPMCMFLCKIFSLFKQYKFPILSFAGTYSLCIYVFHVRIRNIMEMIFHTKLEVVTSTIILTVICAYMWQHIVSYILEKYFNYNIKKNSTIK